MRVFEANGRSYGTRKVWHALRREAKNIARCTIDQLVKVLKIQDVVRGGKIITTNSDATRPCPDDKANREFVAPKSNRLWVSDFA